MVREKNEITSFTSLFVKVCDVGVVGVRVVKLGGKDCEFEGGKICNGAVTKEIGTKLLKVCSDGKIKVKTRKSVGEGFPLVGRDTGEGKGELIDQYLISIVVSFPILDLKLLT